MTEYISDFQKNLWQKLDAKGLSKVKQELSIGIYSGKNKNYAEEWVRVQEEAIESERESRKESREEESLSISRKALEHSDRANEISEEATSIARAALESSRSANWIAKSAIILSIIMAIKEIIEWYSNN